MGRIIDTDDYAFVLLIPRGDTKLPCPNPEQCETDHAVEDADKVGIDDRRIEDFSDPNVRPIDVLGALLGMVNRMLERSPFSAALVPDLEGFTEVTPSGTKTRRTPPTLGNNPIFGTPAPRRPGDGGGTPPTPPWQR